MANFSQYEIKKKSYLKLTRPYKNPFRRLDYARQHNDLRIMRKKRKPTSRTLKRHQLRTAQTAQGSPLRKPLSASREIASGKAPPENRAVPEPLWPVPWNGSHAALATMALCLLVAVSYFPATMAGFVWDDAVLTGLDPIRRWSGIWQIWFEPTTLAQYEGHYWPFLYTTFWLEHKLWGFAPLGYHLVNLLLHGAVTVLLWRLLLRLEVPGAWVVAAVFAVHPLHVESVAWVIGRKDVLATLFYLGAALAYTRFVEDRRRGHYIWALALFLLGMVSKSIVVTLPVSLLIWHWWKQGRVTLTDVKRVLPFLLLGLIITIADWSEYKDREVLSFSYTLIERALIAARALWFYAGKLVWPTELAVIYPHWEVSTGDLLNWLYGIAAIALAALLWHYRGRIGRGPLAGVLFFAVTLSRRCSVSWTTAICSFLLSPTAINTWPASG